MKLLANRRIRVMPQAVTYISRQLEGKGKITVQVGQIVTPEDLIGQSVVAAGLRSINLAQLLSCSPKDGQKYLQRPLGQPIFRGELLAVKEGFLTGKKIVLSPTDGKLESYNEKTGELTLSLMPHQKNLAAAVYGIVAGVDNLKNEVIIKTQVTEIYGLFGTGKSSEGTLHILGQRGDLINKDAFKGDQTDNIVIGGALVYADGLISAISKGVGGIITGGINANEFRSISNGRLTFPLKFGTDIGIGLLVCEGFGSVPIGEDIFNTLLDYNGKFAILEGNKGRLILPAYEASSMTAVTKTELPNIETASANFFSELEAQDLAINQRVRIIGYPNLGEQGMVVALDSQPTKLPSGIMVNLVTIQTKSRKLKVPFTNLEIIG